MNDIKWTFWYSSFAMKKRKKKKTQKRFSTEIFRTPNNWWCVVELTFQRNSPAQMIYQHFDLRLLQFAVNPIAYVRPVVWMHLAAYSRSEWAIPFPCYPTSSVELCFYLFDFTISLYFFLSILACFTTTSCFSSFVYFIGDSYNIFFFFFFLIFFAP